MVSLIRGGPTIWAGPFPFDFPQGERGWGAFSHGQVCSIAWVSWVPASAEMTARPLVRGALFPGMGFLDCGLRRNDGSVIRHTGVGRYPGRSTAGSQAGSVISVGVRLDPGAFLHCGPRLDDNAGFCYTYDTLTVSRKQERRGCLGVSLSREGTVTLTPTLSLKGEGDMVR